MAVTIDYVADTVCPWCYIGKRRLDAAVAARPDLAFDIRWRPFALNPDTPKDGLDRKAHYAEKFGADPEQLASMTASLLAEGEALGIRFAFSDIERVPNTLDSHRVLRWAASAGVQPQLAEEILAAYFSRGEDIGQHDVLIACAQNASMDAALVADLLGGDKDVALIEKDMGLARHIGVTGVPTFILENRLAVVGAQPPEVLTQAIDQAVAQVP